MSHDKETLLYFARFIESRTGIQYGEANLYQLENRLNTIAQRQGLTNLQALYTSVVAKADTKLERVIIEEATNHETSFFRDGGIFRAFQECILPEILAERAKTASQIPVRIWSNACSSGQEAYSIGMLCSESSLSRFDILCTDLSAKILERAKQAEFTELEVKRGLGEAHKLRFFDPVTTTAGAWKVKESLRRHYEFKEHNLLGVWAGLGLFDLIFIRNVLIYQSIENKKSVIQKVNDHLSPGGILIMGAAESLIGISDDFVQRSHNGALFYQKKPKVF